MARGMTIGKLAKAASVSVETIRFYQRLGLLDQPRRLAGAHRTYPEETLGRLAFIRRSQRLGFTLADIGGLLASPGDREAVRRIAQARHAKLALQAEELASMTRKLGSLLEESSRDRRRGVDPIIAALNGGESSAS